MTSILIGVGAAVVAYLLGCGVIYNLQLFSKNKDN